MLAQPFGIWQTLEQCFDTRQVHHFVHQHVRAFGEFGQLRQISGVAGDYDRAIFGVEAIRIRLSDRRMAHKKTADLHVIILHYDARAIELVNEDQLAWIFTALVRDARFDIKLLVTEKILGHLAKAGRSISVDVDGQAGNPRVVEQGAVLKIVIRMVMRNEDVAQSVKRNPGGQQLPRSSIAAINNVGNIVDLDQRRGIAAARLAHARTALCAEQVYPCELLFLTNPGTGEQNRTRKTCGACQKLSATGHEMDSIGADAVIQSKSIFI